MIDLPELLKNIKPHRLTERGVARMAVRREYRNGVLIGRHVDPIVVAGLMRQGYDPEPYVRRLLDVDAEDAPLWLMEEVTA